MYNSTTGKNEHGEIVVRIKPITYIDDSEVEKIRIEKNANVAILLPLDGCERCGCEDIPNDLIGMCDECFAEFAEFEDCCYRTLYYNHTHEGAGWQSYGQWYEEIDSRYAANRAYCATMGLDHSEEFEENCPLGEIDELLSVHGGLQFVVKIRTWCEEERQFCGDVEIATYNDDRDMWILQGIPLVNFGSGQFSAAHDCEQCQDESIPGIPAQIICLEDGERYLCKDHSDCHYHGWNKDKYGQSVQLHRCICCGGSPLDCDYNDFI